MYDNWRNLAAAILNMAIADKEKACRNLFLDPENADAQRMWKDCERFFASDWCSLLLDFLDIDRDKFMEVVNGR